LERSCNRIFHPANEAEEYATMELSTTDMRIVPLAPSNDTRIDILRQGAKEIIAISEGYRE
jgi:hypothetical protein